MAWHPDGSLIAIALKNSQIKIYDRRACKLIQLYNVHLDAVNSIAFHPSGNLMITGSEDGSTKVLDLLEGRPIYTLVGHDDAVTAVAFSGDGNNFATAGKDKQVSYPSHHSVSNKYNSKENMSCLVQSNEFCCNTAYTVLNCQNGTFDI